MGPGYTGGMAGYTATDNGWLLADSSDANFKQEIGRRIAIRRRELGLTQRVLAEETGLSRDFLAHVEVGRLEINAGDMPRLCVALGVPISYFFSDLVESPSDDPVLEAIRKLSPAGREEVTTQEALLLHNFRVLGEKAKDLVSDVAGEMAASKRLLDAVRRQGRYAASSPPEALGAIDASGGGGGTRVKSRQG